METDGDARNEDASQCFVWHPLLQRHALSAVILPLSDAFVSYLTHDGVFLPRMARPDESYGSQLHTHQSPSHDLRPAESQHENQDQDQHENQNQDQHENQNQHRGITPEFTFPTLESQIASVIRHFGGAVFPKLNWSAPTDAAWISPTSTLQCATPSDVFLLLKSSAKITEDLEKKPTKPVLILKKWIDINPSSEFRCYVKDTRLLGICQRHPDAYHDFLVHERDFYTNRITAFYHSFVRGVYPDNSFVFDVYIDGHTVFAVDFTRMNENVDFGLFDWQDIQEMQPISDPSYPDSFNSSEANGSRGYFVWDEYDEHWIDYRVVNLEIGVQPKQTSSDAIPQELRDISWSDLLEKSQHLFQKPGEQSDASDTSSSG
eukprot:TRINITY_DN3095_c0_g1_i1.p1 TRINITY_DN3095_c0_g1~~TRINITY_DN3095_c0_g1_i1.p1  ORF type:complete len:375 (-),score=78.92 TRINITY_DN3095_c0_g1_i1:114-1238(-)